VSGSPSPAPPPASIRDKVDTDLPGITDLWVASWQAAMPQIDFVARRAWFVERMAEHDAAGARTLVALHEGSIVGFAVVDPTTGYLDQLAVLPARQRRGIAAALIAAARRVSPTLLDIHVNQDNEGAISFYEKQGFAVTEADTNPLSGAPVYRMTWRA
jgi:putative acetyltransferase